MFGPLVELCFFQRRTFFTLALWPGSFKGTDLTEYMGRVTKKDEYFEKLQFRGLFNNLEMSYFGMQLTNDFYVDARNCGSIARSFNHSCDPNCKVDAVTVCPGI